MNKIDSNILNNLIIPDTKYVVIGVSAGPDSMALLHILKENLKQKIVCAHINHNIRHESIEEENYLKTYCQNNNLIFECLKIDSYTKPNFENEAREKRYEFYEQILQKYQSTTLFLAHHGDDLIETILMKIIRGSNLEGYAGIKKYSHLDKYTIIRPLIEYTKKEIIDYNIKNNIKYYEDITNNDTKYTRNRYRHKIIPLIKNEDKSVHLKFLKYSNQLQEYYNYVEKVTNDIIKEKYNNNEIDINAFIKEEPLIQKNILFQILSNIYNNKSNIIKEKHILSIINLIHSSRPNSKINLPNNYIAKKTYSKITIEKNKTNNEFYKIKLENQITIDDITIKLIDNIETDGNDVCRLNTENIKLPQYLRNKKSGDYIEVLGLNGKKKVKDIFIENKIPKDIRNTYPVLIDNDDNILWIPNLKKSKYNVKKNEKYDIILTSYKEREEQNEKEK